MHPASPHVQRLLLCQLLSVREHRITNVAHILFGHFFLAQLLVVIACTKGSHDVGARPLLIAVEQLYRLLVRRLLESRNVLVFLLTVAEIFINRFQ